MTKTDWGGLWTEQKLEAFEKYVKAYLTIMNTNRDKFDWKLVYFDAFAGSGSRESTQENNLAISLFDITEEEKTIYRGSAERVVNIGMRGFDYYYFIESNENSKSELENKLNPLNAAKNFDLRYRVGDANEYLIKLAETMKKNPKLYSLTMIDPFGMQVNWESIKCFEGTKTDLWILIPSGVIVNRLLDGNRKLKSIKKLTSFFGLPENEIKEHFYTRDTNASLFEMEQYHKVADPISKIAELYIKRLQTIFTDVTPEPLVLLNSRNVPIYHFAFASNNSTAKKIASGIIGRKQK
jgi:three-Cys-motif partner protein